MKEKKKGKVNAHFAATKFITKGQNNNMENINFWGGNTLGVTLVSG